MLRKHHRLTAKSLGKIFVVLNRTVSTEDYEEYEETLNAMLEVYLQHEEGTDKNFRMLFEEYINQGMEEVK